MFLGIIEIIKLLHQWSLSIGAAALSLLRRMYFLNMKNDCFEKEINITARIQS